MYFVFTEKLHTTVRVCKIEEKINRQSKIPHGRLSDFSVELSHFSKT